MDLAIEQEVINDNKEIFQKLCTTLKEAQHEIIAAVAWFTDPEIFAILNQKSTENVNVSIIIADNAENEKLNFSELVSRGAEVTKIKNTGYGIMHQKFCVVDQRIAMHGSYNWSVNARNNNHESVIYTDHKATVKSLLENFKVIKERAQALASGTPLTETTKPAVEKAPELKSEYESLLNSMIAAEINSFDREALSKQGYDRAQANNGDHLVLTKALDTLYNGFVNDIDVVEDKKRRLLSKIDEQKAKTVSYLKTDCELKIEGIDAEHETRKNNISNEIVLLNSEIQVNVAAIADITNTRIPDLRKKHERLQADIHAENVEFVKPATNKMKEWFLKVLLGGMCLYSFIFYSSAAYIMIYMSEDSKIAQLQNQQISPGIFEPKAFAKAFEHGWMAVAFLCLFVFLPLSMSMMPRILEFNKIRKVLAILGIVIIDFFVAYKVAYEINFSENLTSEIRKQWVWYDGFTDINFWLVLVLGALGLFLIKYLFSKLMDLADDRCPDVNKRRSQENIKFKLADLNAVDDERARHLEEVHNLETSNIRKNAEIKNLSTELDNLPLNKNTQIEARRRELNNRINIIEITTDIYKSHVENDIIPVSTDALKDRINIFLEGWNDYLHAEYAKLKAIDMSRLARETSNEWMSNKELKQNINRKISLS